MVIDVLKGKSAGKLNHFIDGGFVKFVQILVRIAGATDDDIDSTGGIDRVLSGTMTKQAFSGSSRHSRCNFEQFSQLLCDHTHGKLP